MKDCKCVMEHDGECKSDLTEAGSKELLTNGMPHKDTKEWVEDWFNDEEFGKITQQMLEIAEDKRNVDEWNDLMNSLYKCFSRIRTQAQEEAVKEFKESDEYKQLKEDAWKYTNLKQ